MLKETVINLVLILLNVGALAIVWRGLRNIYHGWTTLQWESVPGRITEATIEETVHKRSKSHRWVYQVKTTYQYEVRGRSYVGETITPSYGTTSKMHEHQPLFDWLHNASTVRVFYNPLQPEQSLLLPGINRGMFSLLIIGLICLAITGGFAGMYWLITGGDPALVQSIVML